MIRFRVPTRWASAVLADYLEEFTVDDLCHYQGLFEETFRQLRTVGLELSVADILCRDGALAVPSPSVTVGVRARALVAPVVVAVNIVRARPGRWIREIAVPAVSELRGLTDAVTDPIEAWSRACEVRNDAFKTRYPVTFGPLIAASLFASVATPDTRFPESPDIEAVRLIRDRDWSALRDRFRGRETALLSRPSRPSWATAMPGRPAQCPSIGTGSANTRGSRWTMPVRRYVGRVLAARAWTILIYEECAETGRRALIHGPLPRGSDLVPLTHLRPAPRAETCPINTRRTATRWSGIGIGAGTVTAQVVVAATIDTIDPPDGEPFILVCPQTTPGWLPAMLASVGIVTETGTRASHAAIVARETGIPAVVGVGPLFQTLATGDICSVDADTGTVTIVRKKLDQ